VTKKKRQSIVSWPKVVTVVTFTLVAILTVDFGRKALDLYRIQRQVEWLKQQVAAEQQVNQELQETLDYVSSDAYVEEIARERLKLVKPGETAVGVVLQPSEAVSASDGVTGAEPADAEPAPYWQQWADLLLGAE
jgi:cell division protein FtsB